MDDRSGTLGWGGIVRLGLVQMALGAIVVLTTSTLNRVMVVELALPALLPGLLFAPAFWIQALCTAALALGAGAYLRTPLRRLVTLWGEYGAAERLKALAWVPVIRVVGDVAKMVGYPAGRVWRRARLATQPELRWR